MSRKHVLVDLDGISTGNSWTNPTDNEHDAGFRQLIEQDDGCHHCGYDGQLRSTRKGYKCPECRQIVIPAEL